MPGLLRYVGALALCACLPALAEAAPAPRAPVPLSAIDDQGRTVSLASPATRLLTLAPHATEMVFAAGGADRIIGTVEHSDYPVAALSLPRVGDAWQIHPETLLSLQPDLIVAWQSGPLASLMPALSAARIPVFYSAPARLEDIPANLEKLGVLMGTSSQAARAAGALRQRLSALQARYAHLAPVRVFVQLGNHPLYTLTDRHIVGDALRICGARNVVGHLGTPSPTVDIETVIMAAPDAILSAQGAGSEDPHAAWKRYAPALAAVRKGHVFVLDADALYRPGPRLLDATEQLCRLIDGVRSAP